MRVTQQAAAGAEERRARLSPAERRALLEEIGHVALTLIQSVQADAALAGGERQTVPASPALRSRPDALTSPFARLAFLCALWERMESSLEAIARQPDSRSVSTIHAVALAQSRGGSAAAAAVARSPRPAAAWRHARNPNKQYMPADSALPSAFPSRQKNRKEPETSASERVPVAERVTTFTYDTWANRMTVSLLVGLGAEASALGRLAAFCGAQVEETQASRLAAAARTARTRGVLRGCPPLNDAEQRQIPAQSVIERYAPPYQVIGACWQVLHRPLDFDWTHSAFLILPALEDWHLYEIWCYLQVGAALTRSGWRLVGGDALRCAPAGMRLGLATGRASRLRFRRDDALSQGKQADGQASNGANGRKKARGRGKDDAFLSLYYQPLFSSANQVGQSASRSGGTADDNAKIVTPSSDDTQDGATARWNFASRSHAMQPDIAIHWRGRLALLDPKYKQYAQAEEAQEDVNKMHAYRDAIVAATDKWAAVSARIPAPVAAAWCLFPGVPPLEAGANAQSADVYAYPAPSPMYPFGAAGVGAFRLRPGQPDTSARLAEFLTALIAEM